MTVGQGTRHRPAGSFFRRLPCPAEQHLPDASGTRWVPNAALTPNRREPHNSTLSPLYPQRDSNPCRHLERDSGRGHSERQRPETGGILGFSGQVGRDRHRRFRAAAGFSRYRTGPADTFSRVLRDVEVAAQRLPDDLAR